MEIFTGMLIVLGMCICLVIGVFMYFRSFKHIFVAKFLTSGKVVVKTYKIREIKEKRTKNIMWLPLGAGLKRFPKPSEEVIIPNFRKKGSWYAEGYVNREGEVIQFCQDVPDLLSAKIKPFTQEQRTVTVNQFRKAELKRKGFWDTYGSMISVIGFMLLLIILLFSFWGKIMTPLTEETERARSFQGTYLSDMKNITENLMIASTRISETCGNTQSVD